MDRSGTPGLDDFGRPVDEHGRPWIAPRRKGRNGMGNIMDTLEFTDKEREQVREMFGGLRCNFMREFQQWVAAHKWAMWILGGPVGIVLCAWARKGLRKGGRT